MCAEPPYQSVHSRKPYVSAALVLETLLTLLFYSLEACVRPTARRRGLEVSRRSYIWPSSLALLDNIAVFFRQGTVKLILNPSFGFPAELLRGALWENRFPYGLDPWILG